MTDTKTECIPYFIKSRTLRKFEQTYQNYIDNFDYSTGDKPSYEDFLSEKPEPVTDSYEDSELVCSDIDSNSTKHMPVIDLDFSCFLQDSSTENHHHLYINREVEWEDFCDLLKCMVKCGLVEEGYAGASISRGYTAVRKPGLKKPVKNSVCPDDGIPF